MIASATAVIICVTGEAAEEAAAQFADQLTPGINLGLIAYAGTATVLVSPTTTLEIIVAKIMPALGIATVLGLLMIALAVFVFHVPLAGSFLLLLPSLLLFILSVVGIGLMISSVSATQQQAILGAFAVGVPSVLLSGFATPVENMPQVLQWAAQLIPLTHFLVIVEGTFLKAMPAADIIANTWPLAVIALVTLTLATRFVRSRLQ